mgnify:CR=1 FL=1
MVEHFQNRIFEHQWMNGEYEGRFKQKRTLSNPPQYSINQGIPWGQIPTGIYIFNLQLIFTNT